MTGTVNLNINRMFFFRIMYSTNILIQTDNEKEFNETKKVLKSIVGHNLFTIYQMKTKDLNTMPWMKNCALFVNFEFKSHPIDKYIEFLKLGGKILSLPSNTQNKIEKKLMENIVNVYDGDLKDFYENEKSSVKYVQWADSFLYSHSPEKGGLHCLTKVQIY
jgi:hypothetical protein